MSSKQTSEKRPKDKNTKKNRIKTNSKKDKLTEKGTKATEK